MKAALLPAALMALAGCAPDPVGVPECEAYLLPKLAAPSTY